MIAKTPLISFICKLLISCAALTSQTLIAAPSNDDIANALFLSPTGGEQVYTTIDATEEPGEQGAGFSSVWFKWTAPNTNKVWFHTINTAHTDSTSIGLNTTGLVSTSPNPSSSYYADSSHGLLSFTPVANVTYYLRIGFYNASSVTLTWGPSEERSVSGDIHLPAGFNAAPGVVHVHVSACKEGNTSCNSKTVSIPMGSNSTNYTIDLLPDSDSYTVKYICNSSTCRDYPNVKLYGIGFYNSDATLTTSTHSATPLEAAQGPSYTNIDMTIERAGSLEGTIAIPGNPTCIGYSCATPIEIVPLDPYSDAPIGINDYGEVYNSSSPADFDVKVSVSHTSDSYKVGYRLTRDYDSFPTGRKDFYPIGFAGINETTQVPGIGNAATFHLDANYTGEQLKLFSGNVIAGDVALPAGQLAEKTIEVFIIADTANGPGTQPDRFETSYYGDEFGFFSEEDDFSEFNFERVVIYRGTNSAAFSFKISPDVNTNWRLYYSCPRCGGVWEPHGYHVANDDTRSSPNAAITFFPGGYDAVNKNLTLIPYETLCFPVKGATICL